MDDCNIRSKESPSNLDRIEESYIADLLSSLLSQLTFGDSPNEQSNDGKLSNPNYPAFSRQRHACGESNVWIPNISDLPQQDGMLGRSQIHVSDWAQSSPSGDSATILKHPSIPSSIRGARKIPSEETATSSNTMVLASPVHPISTTPVPEVVRRTESLSESCVTPTTVVDGYNNNQEQKPASLATKVDNGREEEIKDGPAVLGTLERPIKKNGNNGASEPNCNANSSDIATTLFGSDIPGNKKSDRKNLTERYDYICYDDDTGNSIFTMDDETEMETSTAQNSAKDKSTPLPYNEHSSTPKRRGHSATFGSQYPPPGPTRSRSGASSPALSVSSVTCSEVSSLASPPSMHGGDSSFFTTLATPSGGGRVNFPPLPPFRSSSKEGNLKSDSVNYTDARKIGMPFVYSPLKDKIRNDDLNIITESEASNIPAPPRTCAAILGNSSLADLCKFSLDSLQNHQTSLLPKDTSSEEDNEKLEIMPSINLNDNIDTEADGIYKTFEESDFRQKQEPETKKQSLDTPDITEPDPNDSEESVCRNERGDSQPNRRIQMFGSEYARFLSSNLLSPDPPKKKTAIMTKLQHLSHPGLSKNAPIRDLEGAPADVLSGPIIEIVVTHGTDPPPAGFYRISHTANLNSADLSLKSGKVPIFLCVSKEHKWKKAIVRPWISALVVIFPDRGETAPPGYSVVKSYKPSSNSSSSTALSKAEEKSASRSPANLNYGTNGEKIYLCYKRSRENNPITGIIPVIPSKNEHIPEGYTVIERTPRNFVANLNSSGSGTPLFIAIRQRLSNLETLRPIPILIAQMKSPKHRMSAYYCTGGTAVYSNVSLYHVMDRSTHPLLSPKSTTSKFSQYNDILKLNETTSASACVSSNKSFSSCGDGDTTATLEAECQSIYSLSSFIECDSSLDGTDSLRRTSSTDSRIHLLPDDMLGLTARSMKFIPPVVDGTGRPADPSRILAIVPILTACYTHHGGASFVAVEGLTKLLRETSFFLDDKRKRDGDNKVNTKFNSHTLLDLAIQTVCDVATSSAREILFSACIEFTSEAVKYSDGILSSRTIGYLQRFHLFISSFGVSSHHPAGISTQTNFISSSSWPEIANYCGNKSSSFSSFTIDLPLLLNCGLPYFQIGAPYASALSFRDLFSYLMLHVEWQSESEESGQSEPSTTNSTSSDEDSPTSLKIVSDILSDMIDSATMKVDLSCFTQLALHQIRRSGGGELFWHDMVNSCGVAIFGSDNDAFTVVFAMLASLVKVGGGPIRKSTSTGEIVLRDVVTKLLSLELLLHFVKSSGPNLRNSKKFGYIVRRILVQCILSNIGTALDDARVYRRLLHLVTALWTYYREHLKVEIAALFELLVMRVLRLGPQIEHSEPGYIEQQLDALTLVVRWFDMPHNVVTLFVNYDMDGKSGVRHWKICDQLCSTLYNLADQCNAAIAQNTSSNSVLSPGNLQTDLGSINRKQSAARILHEKALHAISRVIKSLMGASGHIYIMTIDKSVRAKSVQPPSGWEYHSDSSSSCDESSDGSQSQDHLDDSADLGRLKPTNWPFSLPMFRTNSTKKFRKPPNEEYQNGSGVSGRQSKTLENHIKKAEQKKTEILESAFRIYEESGYKGLSKCVKFLIKRDFISASPRDVANFLRMYQTRIDPVDLGDYLGEGGTHDEEYWNVVRYHYMRSTSFEGMNIEQGLRHLLTNCGFRLSGEAQRVERVVSTFKQCFWEDNAGDVAKCPFNHEDAVFLLAFAVIMLNTDLHKAPTSTTSSRKRKKMSKQDFVNNLKKIDDCSGIPVEYLTKIYDSIEARPIQLNFAFQPENPLPSNTESLSSLSSHRTLTASDIRRDVKPVQELLRSLSLTDHKFLTVGKDVMLSKDIVRLTVEKTWHHFYGIINSILDSPRTDMQSVLSSLDVLRYALCTTIYLGMDTERIAFTTQLARIKFIKEKEAGKDDPKLSHDAGYYIMSGGHKEETWYKDLETTCNSKETAIEAVDQVNELIQDLQSSFQGSQVSKDIKAVIQRIRHGSYLFSAKSLIFICEGDLTKLCRRSGRKRFYHFFLFSDRLIYSHLSQLHGDYKIHADLPLWLMKVANEDENTFSFKIYHVVKSFTVTASSLDQKKFWINQISQAITEAKSNMMA
mmetsp:Transcript_39313/g.91773  ORF Transcript_39313/g.91773 Transcript_39313/m.91773 type:complete len:2121 (-) Transcript_39313:133-6495(-)